MRTFEFKDRKSNKFWNIELSGSSYTVTYGKIGTAGQTQTKDLGSEAKAQATHDKLVDEKLGKGYVETTSGAATASPSSGKALENAIFANPDDLGAHAAYADWLIEQGDPRGEFIHVQPALEDPKKPAPERKKLQKREKGLLAEHEREWLGELAPYLLDRRAIRAEGEHEPVDYEAELVRGWLHKVKIRRLSIDFAMDLANSSAAQALSHLVIENWYYNQDPTEEQRRLYGIQERSDFPALYPLLGSNCLRNLRVFQLGQDQDDTIHQSGRGRYVFTDVRFSCYTGGEMVVDLVRKMPRLEELYLFANNLKLDQLFALKTLKQLRILQIYHAWDHPLKVLAENSAFANLTHLLLHPKANGSWNDDCPYIKFDEVRAILKSKRLEKLAHLQLRLTTIGDEGCEEIVTSGILKRLKTLDLRHGCITDEGAHILASCQDIENLERLELSRNRLTNKGIRELSAVLKKKQLNAQYQQTPQELEHRDEPNSFLREGDIE